MTPVAAPLDAIDRRTALRRLALAGAAGVLGAAGLSGCWTPSPLSLGIHHWIGYETFYLAADFGWLPNRVELVAGAHASDSLKALDSGAAQAACLTLDEVLLARSRGLPLTVGLILNVSTGADVVLGRPDLERLGQLAGRRLGYEQSALGALILERLLIAADLPPDALTLVDLPPDRQLAAWQAGTVDAVITYEPTASRLMAEGAHRLFDSRQMPDTIFDVLAARRDVAIRQRGLLRALTAAHFRALNHLRINRQDAIHRIATRQRIDIAAVNLALAGVSLPALTANHRYLSATDDRVHHAARQLNELMHRRGLIPTADPLDGLLTPAWLPSGNG